MGQVNKVMILGNVGATPDIYDTKVGSVCKFSVATNFPRKDGEEKVSWHRVVAFGRSADFCQRNVEKGTAVFVEGRLDYSSFTDDEGKTRYFTDIIAQRVELVGRRTRSEESHGNVEAMPF